MQILKKVTIVVSFSWPEALILRKSYDFCIIFKRVECNAVHSVTFGPLRFPKEMFKNLIKLNPESKLLSGSLSLRGKKISYKKQVELEMANFCQDLIKSYAPNVTSFNCKGDF